MWRGKEEEKYDCIKGGILLFFNRSFIVVKVWLMDFVFRDLGSQLPMLEIKKQTAAGLKELLSFQPNNRHVDQKER